MALPRHPRGVTLHPKAVVALGLCGRLQIAADEADDDALDGEVGGFVDEGGGDAGVVAAEDDGSLAAPALDGDALEGRVAVDEAGADAALDVLGLDAGAVVDQDDIAGLEGRLHAVVGEPQAVVVGRPLVAEDGEHFELFL